jgi:hypothetical protein
MNYQDYLAFINALLADQQITQYTSNRIEPLGSEVAVQYPKIILVPVVKTTQPMHARRHMANFQIQISIRSKLIEEIEILGDLVISCLIGDNQILNAEHIRNVYLASEVDIFDDPVFQKAIRISYSKIMRVR